MVFHGVYGDSEFVGNLLVLLSLEAALFEHYATFFGHLCQASGYFLLQFLADEDAYGLLLVVEDGVEKIGFALLFDIVRQARYPAHPCLQFVQTSVAHGGEQIRPQGFRYVQRLAVRPDVENNIIGNALCGNIVVDYAVGESAHNHIFVVEEVSVSRLVTIAQLCNQKSLV